MKRVWIFIHTNNIGGAEKRFAGLWKALQEIDGDYNLVLRKELFQRFCEDSDLKESMTLYNSHIFFIDFSLHQNLSNNYKGFINIYCGDGDIIHFVGEHPFFATKKKQQLFSITQSSLNNLNLKGKVGHFVGSYLSDFIDILDPGIFTTMKKLFFFKRKKIFLTTNSFCDVNLYYALPFFEKNDWFVFLGRFEQMKQVMQLLNALPFIYNAIKERAKKDIHFYFFGYGTLENQMRKILDQDNFKNLPVTLTYNKAPNEVLSKSKFFFSLQLHNNYPSRSLIEALSAGNIPVVTDVGQTRWLAKPEFSYYVPEKFTSDNLVTAIKKIYLENEIVLASKSSEARKFVINEHTIEKMRDYYLGIYKKM